MRDLLKRLPEAARRRALTHPSWATGSDQSYERLEFLGDAVLGLAITEELYRRFPDLPEGDLTKLKAAVVSRRPCAIVAREQGLGELMVEYAPDDVRERDRAELAKKERVLAALCESVIGTAFVELGYEAVAPEIVASFADRIGHALDNATDSKSALQELAQRRGDAVEYRVVSVSGPDHDRRFTMRARLAVSGFEAEGDGRTKKEAGQLAARRLLEAIDQDGQEDRPAT